MVALFSKAKLRVLIEKYGLQICIYAAAKIKRENQVKIWRKLTIRHHTQGEKD